MATRVEAESIHRVQKMQYSLACPGVADYEIVTVAWGWRSATCPLVLNRANDTARQSSKHTVHKTCMATASDYACEETLGYLKVKSVLGL